MLNDSILHVFQVLNGVDALLPVFAHIRQGVLDIFDIHQGTVQLGQSSPNAIQLGLNGCLRYVSVGTVTLEEREVDRKNAVSISHSYSSEEWPPFIYWYISFHNSRIDSIITQN